MIKKIKKIMCNLFGIKECGCSETKNEIKEIKKPDHCPSHLRFRKSCPRCQEVVA